MKGSDLRMRKVYAVSSMKGECKERIESSQKFTNDISVDKQIKSLVKHFPRLGKTLGLAVEPS